MAAFTPSITTHPNRDHADGPDTVAEMVNRPAQAGFDILLPDVKIGGQVFCHSRIARIDPQFKDRDPPAVMSERAEAVGRKVYAQVCVFPEREKSALMQGDDGLRALAIPFKAGNPDRQTSWMVRSDHPPELRQADGFERCEAKKMRGVDT